MVRKHSWPQTLLAVSVGLEWKITGEVACRSCSGLIAGWYMVVTGKVSRMAETLCMEVNQGRTIPEAVEHSVFGYLHVTN